MRDARAGPITRNARQRLAGMLVAMGALTGGIAPSIAQDGVREALACSVCEGLVAHMSGPEGSPFFFRSFEPANGGSALHPTLDNTAFTYDNALAMMALYACDRAAEARRIADALVVAVETDRHYHDGRLRNAYRSGPLAPGVPAIELPGYWSASSNSWIEDGYQVGSATGSTVWGALALLTAHEETQQPAYLDAARKIMRWVHDTTMDQAGLGYFGGFFGHEPTPERLTWKSTEHNLDVYAADRWLERIEGGPDWPRYAGHAKIFLEAMWNDGEGRFFVGSMPDSAKPNVAVSGLDSQLWPLIAVPDMEPRADRVLAWTEAHHGVPGGFDFNDDRDGTWLEGTAQAALVYRLTGQPEKAEPLFATLREQLALDGLVYATAQEQISTGLSVGPNSTPGDFKYFRLPHVGATGWAVLAALDWNPFVGRSGSPARSKDDQCLPKS